MIHTLIVDDSKTELDMLLFLIRKFSLPMEAVTAPNGEAALEELKKERFDLLITDIRMPFLDGLALAREALKLYPYIKIVISSGYQDFSYAKTAISLGVKEYLLKHFRLTEARVCSVHLHRPARRLEESAYQIEHRALSHAVLTEQTVDAVFLEFQTEVFEYVSFCSRITECYVVYCYHDLICFYVVC